MFCGHTHKAFQASANGVRYFNTGAWTHEHLTYAAVDEHGPRLGEYVPPAHEILDDGSDPAPEDGLAEPLLPAS